jgi:iron complex outermembrane receptor protein
MTISTSARRAAAPLAIGVQCVLAVVVPRVGTAQQPVDEVVVTGVPHDRAPGELAQSVTVLRDETLYRIRGSNLGETLANQLGVSSSYFGTGASRPIIRGLAGARVRMLEDGIDSMDAASVSDDHAVSVEPLVAEQIEIFRGPTTLLYGSGAVGGIVNTVTTRMPEIAPDDGFAGAFELRGDSVADDRAGAVRLDGGGNRFAWHFDALKRDGDDYEIPGFARFEPEPGDVSGILPNSAVETDAAALGASWLGEQGFLGLAVSTFDTLYGIPGEEEEPVRIDLDQTRVDVKGGWSELARGIEALNLRIGMNDYEHVELEGEEVGTRFTNDSIEGRVELLHRPIGPWTGAFGFQFSDREFAAIGEEAFVPPVDTSAYGIFLVEQLDLDAWQLSFGGRLEKQEQEPSGGLPAVDDTATSLSVAGVRDLRNGYSLALNLAAAERLPVAEELYSEGPHLATGAIQIGDPALTEETSTHVDVGIRRTEGDLNWSITGFVTSYDAFIFLQDTGVVDPIDALPVFAFVQQDADFVGLEAELFTPIANLGSGEVDMRLFADYVKGELSGGADLPRMPPLRYGARFQYHDDRIILGLEATRYGDQDEIAAYETPTGGYSMINADFRWRIKTVERAELDVFVNGSNLTDEEARKHTSFVKDLAPLPGRNYAVGVRSRF